jgi:hypothetical protein
MRRIPPPQLCQRTRSLPWRVPAWHGRRSWWWPRPRSWWWLRPSRPFLRNRRPFSAHTTPGPDSALSRDEEITLLKSESERLRSILETIDQRLAQIENA